MNTEPIQEALPNPYLNASRAWNGVVEKQLDNERLWRRACFVSLLVSAIAIGGAIYLGTQPKTVPYVVQVDRLGEVAWSGRLTPATADHNVIKAAIASFVTDLRIVTPDAGLQAQAIDYVYAYLSKADPAAVKINSWYSATKDSNPYKRAEDEIVTPELNSVIQQTTNTWQVDWTETVRDRHGDKAQSTKMRALVTMVLVPPNSSTPEAEVRRNPLGIYIQDINWSRLE